MKRLIVLCGLLFFVITMKAQIFDLDSKELRVNDIYTPNPNIRFDFAKWTILPESLEELDRIAKFLIENDSVIVEVRTHTDGRGSQYSSRRLDYKRSESVVAYLMSKGVPQKKLIAKGRTRGY